MNAREYFTVLREGKYLIIGSVVVCVAIAYVLSMVVPKSYAASATFFVSAQITAAPGSPNPAADSLQGAQLSLDRVKTYIELVTGPRVAEDAAGRLGDGTSPAEVQQMLTATSVEETVLFTVTATGPSPERVVAVMQAVTESLEILVTDLETPFGGEAPLVSAQVVQRPIEPDSPVSPQPTVNLAIGFLLGVLIGFGIAIGRRSLDVSVRSAEMLEQVTDAAVLGVVPEDAAVAREPVVLAPSPKMKARSRARAEAYQRIRTNLGYSNLDGTRRVLVVTSALPSDGKSVTVCNLAVALAAVGARVLLVDADLRRPKSATYLGLHSRVGLTEVLTNKVPLDLAVQRWDAGGFDVLAGGRIPPRPSELLSSRRTKEVVSELRRRYDFVLIDAPPVLPVVDAANIGAHADGAIVVCRWGKTSHNNVASAVSFLRSVSVPVVGTVLSRAPAKSSPAWGTYGTFDSTADFDTAAGPETGPPPVHSGHPPNGHEPRIGGERAVPAQNGRDQPRAGGELAETELLELMAVPASSAERQQNGNGQAHIRPRPSPNPRPTGPATEVATETPDGPTLT